MTERLNNLLATSYADNTIASYTSKMNLFITFLTRHQLMLTRWNGSAPTMPTVTPTTLMFSEGNGGESRKSFHGCARLTLLHSYTPILYSYTPYILTFVPSYRG